MTLASKSHTATQATPSCFFMCRQASSRKEHQIATGRYSSGALTKICVNYVAGTYNVPPCLCQSTLGPTLPTPRSTPAWSCTSCCHFDVVSVFFVVFAISLLRRFLYDPLALVLCRTLVTRITFLWSFPKPGLHTCFGLNLTRGLNKSHVFASRPSFTESAVLHKNHVLAGPVQALFAARMALSMVAKTAEGG